MAGQITQCPQCQTSFRVTDEQLNIAGGAVRCGSCLHIFNAAEHWQNNGSNPAGIESNENTSAEIEVVDQAEEIHASLDSELTFSDTRKEAAIDQLFAQDELLFPSTDDNDDELLFSDEQGIEDGTANDQIIEDADEETTIIFEQGLSSSEEFTPSKDETGFSESFLDLDDWDDEPDNVFKDLDELNEDNEGDESWANALLDDTTEHNVTEQQTEAPIATDEDRADEVLDEFPDLLDALGEEAEQPLSPDLLNILGEANPHSNTPPPEDDEFILGDEPMVAGERIADDKEALLANIEPEPVQIHGHKKTTSWRDWGMRAAAIAAIALLGIQYINFNFERLSRDQQYRPLFAQACNWLSCTLPALYDVSRIHSSNLIIRSHPDANNALIIDTIITNRANFQQPFPLMTLTFTNLAGDVIAGRQFKPKDYLAGEMLGSKIMPAKQPIHIALEIVDPGQQALNYQLQFSPNTDS